MSGQIKELYADFNSQVTKGQIIARIDPALFQAQVDEAQAQVLAARASVLSQQAMVAKTRADLASERAAVAVAQAQTAKAQVTVVDGQRTSIVSAQLLQRQLIAQADVDAAQVASDSNVAQHTATTAQESAQAALVQSAEAQLKVVEAQLQSSAAQVGQYEAALRQAQLNLDHSIIRSPADGVVIARNVDVGQTVAASLQAPTLFLIAQDLTKMQVDTSIDESDVERVRVAQPVDLHRGLDLWSGLLGARSCKCGRLPRSAECRHVRCGRLGREPRPQAPAGHDGQRPDHHRPEGHRAQGAERRTALPPTGSGDRTRPDPGGRTGSRSG